MTSDPPPAPFPLRPGALAAAGLLVLVTVGTLFLPLPTGDLWSHVKYGRWMLDNHKLPTEEPFTPGWAGDADKQHETWVMSSWLSDVLLGAAGSPAALVALRAGLAFLRYLFVLMAVRRAAPDGPPLVLALAAAVAFDWHTLPNLRPDTFAQVLFAALLVPLSRERFSWAGLVAVPVVFAAWVNVHESATLGLTVLALFVVGRVADSVRANGWRVLEDGGLARLLVATVLAVGATPINPYGLDLFHRVMEVRNLPAVVASAERLPLAFGWRAGWHWAFLASVLAAAVTFAWSGRWVSLATMAVMLVAALAAMIQVRYAPAWAVVLPWALAPHWAFIRERAFAAAGSWLTRPWLHWAWFASVAAGGVALFAVGGPHQWVSADTPAALASQLLEPQQPDAEQPDAEQPDAEQPDAEKPHPPFPELAEVLRDNYPNGRYVGPVLATARPGDYLLNALPADTPVTYWRPDLFPQTHWDELKSITVAKGSWWEIMDRKGFNLVVVEPGEWAGFRDELRRATAWRVVVPPGAGDDLPPLTGPFVAVRRKPILPPGGDAK